MKKWLTALLLTLLMICAAEPELVPGVQTVDLLGNAVSGDLHGGFFLIGMDGEPGAGLDADHLIQIEMVEPLLVHGHGQDGHVGMVAHPDLGLADEDRAFAPDKLQDPAMLALLGQIPSPDPFGFDGAKGLEGKLIQVADHSYRLRNVETPNNGEPIVCLIIPNRIEICKGYFTNFTIFV